MKVKEILRNTPIRSQSSGTVQKPLKCPWCGSFDYGVRTNCVNCGGPLPARTPDNTEAIIDEMPAPPPPPPRVISKGYVRKLMFANSLAVLASISALIGIIFGSVGFTLTVFVVTAFVGIPFMGIGILSSIFGFVTLKKQHDKAKAIVEVLRNGHETKAVITKIEQNFAMTVNGRHPYIISYEYAAEGQNCAGSVQTFQNPAPVFKQSGKAWVLYSPGSPEISALYPHP